MIEPIGGKELHDVLLTDAFDQTCGQYYVQGSMKMTLDGTEAAPDVTFNPADKDDSIKNTLTMSANGLPAKAEIEAKCRGTSTMLTKTVGSYDPKTHEISWTMALG